MGRIRLLPEQVASQVAAGEVVERPASVVKELVENSLDAGARRIEIEFARGGAGLIRIADDGSGMDRDDALMSLERHATSKIRAAADLATVGTFGFRGEALPSIASVSKFRMVTRPREAEAGTEIVAAGGRVLEVRDAGEAFGTSIEIRSLFYNVPARLKFLRGEQTEAGHLLHQITLAALARPEAGFGVIRDGRLWKQLPAAASLGGRVRDLFGGGAASQFQEVGAFEWQGIRLRGFFAKPGAGRLDKAQQFVFINGRPVQNPGISQGFREACAGVLERGMNPAAIVFIELEPAAFDCNVHPAKREVRFREPLKIREAAYEFARHALSLGRAKPATVSAPVELSAPVSLPKAVEFRPRVTAEQMPLTSPPSLPLAGQARMAQPAPPVAAAVPEKRLPDFRLIGPLGKNYLLLESAEGLVTLELAAARERIDYETLCRQMAAGGCPSQGLLPPVVVNLDPRDFSFAVEHLESLRAAGLQAEAFGPAAVKIDALPAGLADARPGELLLRLLDEIREGIRSSARRFVRDWVALALAKAAGERMIGNFPAAAAQDLVQQLMACELPYASPTGRPTLLQTSWSELARKFGKSP
ncbi:MAG TPA: DNA mismatch repair endonuclease MutL [Chthoniobacterales bacterium]